ncbi:DUF1189 domain-containing protein [Enterococcus saccharolyticus]|uniref:DUF1189 domain-containing protein n=1 Tax=Enterococcus saccharolyticus TaxID=41997 RepID=UPI001E5DF00D|nr:DUF1189 domain-containing protein [Enterococcus saccharolyticus]MCD5003359.1 DUF1189 domain-containing protein [Enterococcus saccharolyticus]
MSIIQLAKYSISDFKKISQVKKIGFGKLFIYLLLLSVLSAIPITTQVISIFKDIQADGREIAEKIPDFSIKNGKLNTTNQGFIYQTNSIIFTFDPDGQRDTQDVAKDMLGNFLSVGLLTDQLVIVFPSSDVTSSIIGSNQLELPYTRISDLNGKTLRQVLGETSLPWWMILISFLVVAYPTLISMVFSVLVGTLFGNMYCLLRRIPNRFSDNFKITVASTTLPVIISMIISLFFPSFNVSSFIMLSTMFIFTQAVKNEHSTV